MTRNERRWISKENVEYSGIFVGWSGDQPGAILENLDRKVFVSYHLIFDEDATSREEREKYC